jgi:hypothetical protein
MAVIVNRGAAGIHSDGIVRFRLEFFHLAGKRVVKAQGQTVIVTKSGGTIRMPGTKSDKSLK